MPQLETELTAIVAQLKEDIRTACDDADMEISDGFPRKEITSLPSATVMLMELASDFQHQDASAVELGTGVEIGVEIRLPMPEDEEDPGLWAKVAVMDSIASAVEVSDGLYGGYGLWPRISRVMLNIDEAMEEEMLTMQLQISMVITKRYGS